MTFGKVVQIRKVSKLCLVGGVFARRRTDDALAAIAAASLTSLQAEVARIKAAVRYKLADMDVRLEDMSDVDIIIFVSKRQYRPTR